MPIETAFGEVLREYRRQRGMSQEELALDSGYSRNYVGLLEAGKKSPTLTAISRLAQVLKVAPSELVRKAEERADTTSDCVDGA